ncbi:MAG: MarR family transcriptional regulator [Rhodococcus sp.]|nr:MarR family transcriptional regulator [Rhodococcus sp. (in: high G+C Gram-positive bacteria)]
MSVTRPTTEELVDEVFLFGRALRDALTSDDDSALPPALTGVLFMLSAHGECRQNELAAQLFVGQSALSRQITELVNLGLVERRSDPADGRAFRVSVSDQGHSYIQTIKDRRASRLQALLDGWTETEAADAVASLRRLRESLT